MAHLGHVRRAAAALAAPALVVTGLVTTSAPASAAADPAPASATAAWLTGQLQDGIVHNAEYDYDDIGLTIDVALALDAVGAPGVEGISDAVAARVTGYVSPGYGTTLSAGGSAKALVLAVTAGADPASYGGRDLVADLESRVSTAGATAGRIQDDWDPSDPYAADYANVFGQAFAVQGLDAVGSARTDAATDFLLAQQCAAGYFRQDFAAVDAADQTCDGGTGAASVDATAAAITGLRSQLDDADVAAHVADAVDWLLARQKRNGGFSSSSEIPTANANSTGAAGYALHLAGEDKAAALAGAWLRAHQLANVASCAPFAAADTGAVVYDDAARTTAQAGALEPALNDQTVRATADALPGLLAAPTGAGEPNLLVAPGYVRAGKKTEVGVNDAAPGEALCAMLGEQSVLGWADPSGEASLAVRPVGAGAHTVTLANAAGTISEAELAALGRASFSVKASGTKVTVRRMAPGETGRLVVRWANGSRTKRALQAGGRGVATVKLPGRAPAGAARATVTGEFDGRAGTARFRVGR